MGCGSTDEGCSGKLNPLNLSISWGEELCNERFLVQSNDLTVTKESATLGSIRINSVSLMCHSNFRFLPVGGNPLKPHPAITHTPLSFRI